MEICNLSLGHTAVLVKETFLMCNLNVQAAVCGCRFMLHHPILLKSIHLTSVIFAAPLQILAGSLLV